MKVCPNCQNNLDDAAVFCTACGATLGDVPPANQAQPQSNSNVPPQGQVPPQNEAPQGAPYYAPPVQPVVDPFDHTDEFDAKDIADNKLLAMLVYLFGLLGVVVAYIAKKDSPYLEFHVKQGLKLGIAEALVGLVTAVLSWTCIVPVVGSIALVVLMVIQVIAFVDVCNNKAKEPAIIRNLKFFS